MAYDKNQETLSSNARTAAFRLIHCIVWKMGRSLRVPKATATLCDLSDRFFVFAPGHCVNFKVMRDESKNLNRVVADELHRVNSSFALCDLFDRIFVFTLGHCVHFKAMRYVSTSHTQ